MRVVTFYSYKGGVGRTLACANFGIYLAKTGQKVVLADMDFEAPGLDSKFFSDATTNISNGLLDQISAFQQGSALPNLSPIQIGLSDEVTRSGGVLQLIPAGNYGAPRTYYETLSRLDWNLLLRSEEGLSFWFDLVERIKTQFNPDVLVIDSRTGITEIGGLCTQVLPDTVLLLSSTSPESMAGTRRMYEIIRSSSVVKNIRRDKPPIDLRVVLTRVPRQDKPEDLDRKMKLRLDLEIPRLYYVFADSRLATEEYLAMNSSSERAESMLSDYVELFASLNPEDTFGYVRSRLASFREGLTLRKEGESRRVMQELLTLFPRTEVYLEAARYFRLVKESDDAVENYLKYLNKMPNNRDIIAEFAEVCVLAPLATVAERRDSVVRHLSTLGPAHMDGQTLSLFFTLTSSIEQRQLVVDAIEGDPAKLTAQPFRVTLFRALNELQQWERLVASATDLDLKDVAIQRILARAYAKLHMPDKALQILHKLPMREPTDAMPLVEIFYDLRSDVDKTTIRKALQENRYLNAYLSHYVRTDADSLPLLRPDDQELRAWVRDLLMDKRVG